MWCLSSGSCVVGVRKLNPVGVALKSVGDHDFIVAKPETADIMGRVVSFVGWAGLL